jgi:hypothetical protein
VEVQKGLSFVIIVPGDWQTYGKWEVGSGERWGGGGSYVVLERSWIKDDQSRRIFIVGIHFWKVLNCDTFIAT